MAAEKLENDDLKLSKAGLQLSDNITHQENPGGKKQKET